jgi:hypothetical protein
MLEANANLVASYPITWALYAWVIPPLFHMPVSKTQSLGLTVLFSAASFVRQFMLRRIFVWWEKKRHVQQNSVV